MQQPVPIEDPNEADTSTRTKDAHFAFDKGNAHFLSVPRNYPSMKVTASYHFDSTQILSLSSIRKAQRKVCQNNRHGDTVTCMNRDGVRGVIRLSCFHITAYNCARRQPVNDIMCSYEASVIHDNAMGYHSLHSLLFLRLNTRTSKGLHNNGVRP